MGGKYGSQIRQAPSKPKRREPHPIWRGVGFALMILTPILGWFGSILILEQNAANNWFPLPGDLLVRWQDPLILIKVVLAVFIMLFLVAIFQLITFVIRGAFGAPRYGPYDVPAVPYRGKKKSR